MDIGDFTDKYLADLPRARGCEVSGIMSVGAFRQERIHECNLLDLKPAGDVFNVCSSESSSWHDAIAILERIAGCRIAAAQTFSLEDTLRWMYEA